MKKHDNIEFRSTLEMEISQQFKTKLLKLITTINPNIHTVVLMDFGLEDDERSKTYTKELVIELNDVELFLSKIMEDMETFKWFNNVSMNQAYCKYVMNTILELIESNTEEIEEII